MLDQYWLGDVERISPEAPVPIVRVIGEEFRPGGAANVALNVHSLEASAGLLSITGSDSAASTLKALLTQAGIDPLLQIDPSMRTTVKLRVSGRSQQLLRIDFENEPRAETLSAMLDTYRDVLAGFHAVIFSDYGKGGLGRIETMITLAREHNIPVLVDPKGDNYLPYSGATMLTPNRAELARVVGQWTREADLEERAQALRTKLDVETLLVTRSEEGMSLFDADGHFRVSAEAQEVFDVTGAGDTVIATLGVLLAAGMTAREAIVTANRAAGLVIAKFGTASVHYEELFG